MPVVMAGRDAGNDFLGALRKESFKGLESFLGEGENKNRPLYSSSRNPLRRPIYFCQEPEKP
jgi:hypothetical protein